MIDIIEITDSERWDGIVTSFAQYDVYYLSGYVKGFRLHGDGEPELMYYDSESLRAIYVYMKRAVEDCWFDAITPYGYGGVLFEGDSSQENIVRFYDEFVESMRNRNIVSNFVRYHPQLRNADNMRSVATVIDLGNTIEMALDSEEVILQNMIHQNRTSIRKAAKRGVEIRCGQGAELFDEFIEIYNSTMSRDEAKEYYYFGREFYDSLANDLKNNYLMFYAVYEGVVISMAIMLFANGRMHYHLAGSRVEYRNMAAGNLLLYEAALWGVQHGYKTLHLGGGVGSGEDNLFRFKRSFNKNYECQFSIGKEIFLQDIYSELVQQRIAADPEFDVASNFFPLYRS